MAIEDPIEAAMLHVSSKVEGMRYRQICLLPLISTLMRYVAEC